MDKNAIKKFAIWARRELIARVSQKAEQYGITEEHHGDADAERIGERLLTRTEQSQRKNLIIRIEQEGYRQVMEEVAYTWFNRFIALRFMEVNGYLPTRIRVFTDEENAFKPQILAEAIHMEMDGLDMEKVYAFKEKNQTEELYKYLLITQCNALSSILPGMFQTISDYTELLFPDNLLREGSVIEQMIALIPESDWQDQVQIIGWLYQYYNTEPKDQVFANLKKNIKISKHDIPAATQLFTPDWIVRYMVENSLGRLWVEGHPDEALQSTWKYYLPEAEQEPQVQAQLAEICKEYANIKPEDIRCIDPCMGSGHILCYLFDVLVQIYEAYGYSTREAVQSIVENNLYGLDIDDRAAQLAYFAVMMKARQYDRRFFIRGIQPHVMAIQESNTLEAFDHLQGQLSLDNLCLETANQLIRTFRDAKEYGSILEVDIPYLDTADRLMEQLRAINGDFELMTWITEAEVLLPALAKQAEIMQKKYDVVVTNPPYMGSSNMNEDLSNFVKNEYPEGKSDLCTCFIEKSFLQSKPNGFCSLITMESWMSLSSFKDLRALVLNNKSIVTMVHMPYLGKGGTSLGINFGTSATVIRNAMFHNFTATFDRVVYSDCDEAGVPITFPVTDEYYNSTNTGNFNVIPGNPLTAYYATDAIFSAFAKGKYISNVAIAASGTSTGDNDAFLRLWHEVFETNITFNAKNGIVSSGRWFPCNKGGAYRRWAGGGEYVIDWENDGYRIKRCPHAFLRNIGSIFKSGLTWSKLGSGSFSIRSFPDGYICESIGCCLFAKDEDLMLILALLNSKVAAKLLLIINPSMGRQPGYIGAVPFLMIDDMRAQIHRFAVECTQISQTDWDSYETSWDFKRHPIIRNKQSNALWGDPTPEDFERNGSIQLSYGAWQSICEDRFQQLKKNEEELNRIFIDIYGLQDELTPEVADKDVTVHRVFDSKDDVPESMKGSAYVRTMRDEIVSLISYAVGCMFGRYSIYKPGLIFAGEPYSLQAFVDKINDQPGVVSGQELNRAYRNEGIIVNEMFIPDKDGILPITDDEYFDDDIVGRFVEFIRTVYGEDTLEENLKFVADALGAGSPRGSKGAPRQVIRDYFLNDFYADHLKTYQKRPIYWLFDSGKKNGFKCLIYMHRYAPDTIARIRTDYVHEQQSRYRTAIADLEKRIANASTAERVKLTRQLAGIQAQADELHIYEEKIHHYADQMIPIDLDDAKFADVLAKIK